MSIQEIILQAEKEQEVVKAKVFLPVVDDGGENSLDHGRAYAHGDVASILSRHLRGDFPLKKAKKILNDVLESAIEDTSDYSKAKFEVYERYLELVNEIK